MMGLRAVFKSLFGAFYSIRRLASSLRPGVLLPALALLAAVSFPNTADAKYAAFEIGRAHV